MMQEMVSNRYSFLLHQYARLLAFGILILICSGGLVTSKNAGLAVPDWPTTYGYNMFAFPVSRWVGGVLYEHSHRLIASGIGLATFVLGILVFARDPRRWMCYVAVAAIIAVLVQGLLGGLRVVWLKDYIGIFHACLAQAFLVLVSLIALFESRFWIEKAARDVSANPLSANHLQTIQKLINVTLIITILIYIQLAVGAAMRHQHIGLSIPDFPLAYGKLLPSTTPSALESINTYRQQVLGLPATTATQIWLQMAHRFNAFLIAGLTIGTSFYILLKNKNTQKLPKTVSRLVTFWPLLILIQITLGIFTIWTNKAADVATTHVAVGAISLVWGAILIAVCYRYRYLAVQSSF